MSYRQDFNNHCDLLEKQGTPNEFLDTLKSQYASERKLFFKATLAGIGAIIISSAHLFVHI